MLGTRESIIAIARIGSNDAQWNETARMKKLEFASREWIAFAGNQLTALADRHRDELRGANYVMCQRYVNGPPELGIPAWWFRVTARGLRWGFGALPTAVCDGYMLADYRCMATLVCIDTAADPGNAERMARLLTEWMAIGHVAGFDAPDRRPRFVSEIHDILARATAPL
jgi:hypothetical protein